MFGELLGKIITAPLRIVNIPLKIVDKIIDDDDLPKVSKPIDVVAEVIEESTEEALGDE